jgi:hypothetical protein
MASRNPNRPDHDYEAEEPQHEEEEEDEVQPLRGGGRTSRTRNAALQAKLDALAALAAQGDVRGFCAAFLPLDLAPDEAEEFTSGLAEDVERWRVIAAEVTALARGEGVTRVLGDQKTSAEFRFTMPGRDFIGREVVFTCVGGEWRAQG